MTKIQELEAKYIELGEQIQALKEPEFGPFWEPSISETYFSISDGNPEVKEREVTSDVAMSTDGGRVSTGNCYKTRELAQRKRDYQFAEQRLRKAVWNLNKGPAPKFKARGFDTDTHTHTVHLSKGGLITNFWPTYQTNPDWLWFHTEALAEQLIESHREDLMTYLHGA